MLLAGQQIDISRKSIYTSRITIDSMIFKDQTNQNTPCVRFGLHMVRTWYIKHRLQQMQGFHEKHVQYGLTFHLFKFFLIFITTQRGFDLKKVPPAKGRLL